MTFQNPSRPIIVTLNLFTQWKKDSNSLPFIPTLNTHLLQTLSGLGTLLGAGDAVPTSKEITGFGQKVEQKCSIYISVNAQG